MIISRTPFRLSFFGGGTDYPAWYREHGGAVLSATIDKYCYIFCRELPPWLSYRYRIVWSKIELCQFIDEIVHPAVREALRLMNSPCPIEIHHATDLPAKSGVGSSSSFTVGVLSAIYRLENIDITKRQLALSSIRLEQDILKECVGSQDQIATVFGGLNRIDFPGKTEDFRVTPMNLSKDRLEDFNQRLMLFFTGVTRTAADIASSYVFNPDTMQQLRHEVDLGIEILAKGELNDFGLLLDEAWRHKKELSTQVTNSDIDDLYDLAKARGALGGKMPGAGGGGFILLFVKPEDKKAVLSGLSNLTYVPFRFDFTGNQIMHDG